MKKVFKVKRFCAVALILLLVLLVTIPSVTMGARQNYYPVVLVHGFGGWDRSEMLGFKYWGGLVDLQQVMKDAGYTTYTTAVGPYSSNWDRACELYAYIKGGTVDYGKSHSQQFGHARYGKTYPGIYKEWGNVVSGKTNKIHLVGHSMGGQTVRTLLQLLKEGSAAERTVSPSDLNPLFAGGKSWVHSISTIATPNDGTTSADQERAIMKGFAKDALTAAAAAAGCSDNPIFDFKLDQWGLKRNSGESWLSYSTRVWNSPIWTTTQDFSLYDLSTDGAMALNKWVKAQSDVYYYSYAFNATIKDVITGYQIPEPFYMNASFYGNTYWMGKFTRNISGRPIIDSTWWPNDGYVNTISQRGPKWGSSDVIVNYNGTPQIGKWNFMGTEYHTDHEDAIGRNKVVNDWYRSLSVRLGELPAAAN